MYDIKPPCWKKKNWDWKKGDFFMDDSLGEGKEISRSYLQNNRKINYVFYIIIGTCFSSSRMF